MKILNPIGLSTILQSINAANKDEVGGSESGGNEINLSNPSPLKKSTKAGYLTFGGIKNGGGNIKKVFKPLKASIT